MASVLSWPGESGDFIKYSENGEFRLLAPEEYLEKIDKPSGEEQEQSEMFSVGATVLSAGILDDLSGVYGSHGTKFNSEAFEQRIGAWRSSPRYSELFKSIVLNLLEENARKRLTSWEMWIWIEKYAKIIEAKEQFMIAKAPEKIEKQVDLLRSSLKK